ncbi:MAG TPA: hypothetical protein VGS57_20200 [Thermoanaerobaculia bacterium]|jgi:hypothetical protein|nr:hypothetical protein [Thermoanaerobaculia bacterium]
MRDPIRHVRWLYLACTVLLLLPLWTVPRVPTVDGPCHLYNAWVMHHLDDAAQPAIGRHFHLDPQPVPNWLIQALLYALLAIAPAALAEKLLLTGYVLLFAAAAWWLAGVQEPARRVNAFLALPFVYTLLFHFGFYNFVFSVPLAMLAVGWWWRGRARPTWRWMLGLHALLLLCWFAHAVSFTVAGLAIAVLWLASWEPARWRLWLLHPLLLLPQLLLPLWFVRAHPGPPVKSLWTLDHSFRYLVDQRALFVFHAGRWPGKALTVLFLLLAIATLLGELRTMRSSDARDAPPAKSRVNDSTAIAGRARERHAFLLVALAILLLYFFAPGGMAGGGILEPRLALFPFVLALPGLALPRLERGRDWMPAALATALTVLVAWESAALVRWHRAEALLVAELLAVHAAVPPHSRGLDLVFGRYDRLEHEVLGHAVDHVAMQKDLVDWDDYQAGTDLFVVRFRPEVERPTNVEKPPADFDVAANAPRIDWLYTWSMPADSPLRPRLAAFYDRAAATGRGELWLRHGNSGPAER